MLTGKRKLCVKCKYFHFKQRVDMIHSAKLKLLAYISPPHKHKLQHPGECVSRLFIIMPEHNPELSIWCINSWTRVLACFSNIRKLSTSLNMKFWWDCFFALSPTLHNKLQHSLIGDNSSTVKKLSNSINSTSLSMWKGLQLAAPENPTTSYRSNDLEVIG